MKETHEVGMTMRKYLIAVLLLLTSCGKNDFNVWTGTHIAVDGELTFWWKGDIHTYCGEIIEHSVDHAAQTNYDQYLLNDLTPKYEVLIYAENPTMKAWFYYREDAIHLVTKWCQP